MQIEGTIYELKSLGKMVVQLWLLRGIDWRTDLGFWSSHKCVLLQDLDESHLSLHEGKPHPNAVARTPTKRHVADTGTFCLLLRSEPVGRAREEGIDQSGNHRQEVICHHDLGGGEEEGRGTAPSWVEFLRICPVLWVVVEEVNRKVNYCSLGDGHSIDFNSFLGSA